jgi:hypothetical protein
MNAKSSLPMFGCGSVSTLAGPTMAAAAAIACCVSAGAFTVAG